MGGSRTPCKEVNFYTGLRAINLPTDCDADPERVPLLFTTHPTWNPRATCSGWWICCQYCFVATFPHRPSRRGSCSIRTGWWFRFWRWQRRRPRLRPHWESGCPNRPGKDACWTDWCLRPRRLGRIPGAGWARRSPARPQQCRDIAPAIRAVVAVGPCLICPVKERKRSWRGRGNRDDSRKSLTRKIRVRIIRLKFPGKALMYIRVHRSILRNKCLL